MRMLAAIFWVPGMSLRGMWIALATFGVQISNMTVWRDLQEQVDILGKRHPWLDICFLGVGWSRSSSCVALSEAIGQTTWGQRVGQ